jgi:hypothetical protein
MTDIIKELMDLEEIKCKLHFRKQRNGNVYVQGVIPANYNFLINNMLTNDTIGVVDITIQKKYLVDKTKEFAGKSNEVIIMEGI